MHAHHSAFSRLSQFLFTFAMGKDRVGPAGSDEFTGFSVEGKGINYSRMRMLQTQWQETAGIE